MLHFSGLRGLGRRTSSFVRGCAQFASTEHCRRLFGLEEGHLTDANIRKGYRAAARRLHPDKGGKSEEFQDLQKCYNSLLAEAGKKDKTPEWLEKMKKDFANYSCC
mmetsp:Transcript_37660/g.46632  ORF Transcript_37660/g.46632 Transcript_37660/m.46632 type:complete len:106 (-) Transcript_37660:156-473(-)